MIIVKEKAVRKITNMIVEIINNDDRMNTQQRKEVFLKTLKEYFNDKETFRIFTQNVHLIK